MKKGIRFSLIILGIGTLWALAGWGVTSILKYCGLMFRAWVGTLFSVIMALLGFTLVAGIIYTLGKMYGRPQEEKRKKVTQKVVAAGGIIATLIASGVLGVVLLFLGVFSYHPEHVVEKHGQKMVAYVDSFVEVFVEYHEYKNFLVCGYQVIGEEWYGSGGYDPFKRDPMPEPKTYEFYDAQGNLIAQSEEEQSASQGDDGGQPDGALEEKPEVYVLDIHAAENQENELVFDISIADFIASYDSLYLQDYPNAYFRSVSRWSQYSDISPYFTHDGYRYYFTQDEKIWSMPTMSIYTPTNEPSIYEIQLTFDDHGYQESLYEIYKEICFYSLKALLPDFTDDEISLLYSDLYALTGSNFYGDNYQRPPNEVYYRDGIGFYGYYGPGTANICVIPVNEAVLEAFSQEGVVLHNLENGPQGQP